jgi:hypothetical protein
VTLLHHLTLKGADELPKSAKHGFKSGAESEIIDELKLTQQVMEFSIMADSTLCGWIGKLEDTALAVYVDTKLKKKPFVGCDAIIRTLGVKHSSDALTATELVDIERGILILGKTINDAEETKKKKVETERQDAKKKAAKKRELQASATKAGKKPTKLPRMTSNAPCRSGEYEDEEDNIEVSGDEAFDDNYCDEEGEENQSPQAFQTRRRRNRRPLPASSSDSQHHPKNDNDNDSVEDYFGGGSDLMSGLSKLMKENNKSATRADPYLELALANIRAMEAVERAKEAAEKTKQMQLELKMKYGLDATV